MDQSKVLFHILHKQIEKMHNFVSQASKIFWIDQTLCRPGNAWDQSISRQGIDSFAYNILGQRLQGLSIWDMVL